MTSDCYVIAEAGLNHNGSLQIAKQLIDVAYVAGVDAVKFQKRTVEKLAIDSVLDAEDNRFPEFGKTYRKIREHLEFSFDEYNELKCYAEDKGLDFIVTAFDIEAVKFLEKLGVGTYKIASHSLTNLRLLEFLAQIRKHTILSTGMAELEEIDQAVEVFQAYDTPLSLLHCVSAYPTALDESNLAMISELKKRYGLPVGYSGHEQGTLPTLVAVARGAQMIERHFTLDKSMVGFDHAISLEPDELIGMVRNIRDISKICGSGKKYVSEAEWITRKKYHVSIASAVSIPSGIKLTEDMITYLNPGTGMPPKLLHTIIGKHSKQDIQPNILLNQDMFE